MKWLKLKITRPITSGRATKRRALRSVGVRKFSNTQSELLTSLKVACACQITTILGRTTTQWEIQTHYRICVPRLAVGEQAGVYPGGSRSIPTTTDIPHSRRGRDRRRIGHQR